MSERMFDLDEKFAYGCDGHGSVVCPVVKSKCAVRRGVVGTIVGLYDTILREEKGNDRGVVSEREAKEAWMEAIRRARTEDDLIVSDAAIEQGLNVAYDLGWMDGE